MQKFLKIFNRVFSLAAALLWQSNLYAQTQTVEMADTMRSNGKIYVVVAVALTIMLGLFIYVFAVDRKVSKLEKELRNGNI